MRYFAVLVFILPMLVFAQSDAQAKIDALLKQIADLKAQLDAQNASGGQPPAVGDAPQGGYVCPSFPRTLQVGVEGSDVLELQKILASGSYLKAAPSGYFGSLTQKALGDFQVKVKLVTGTSPATGWGIFGPKTRAFFAKLCADEIARRTSPVTVSVPACTPASSTQPAEACAGYWQKLYDTKQCHVGWQCFVASAPSAGNRPPIIASIDGPTSLPVGAYGAWTVSASDPEGGTLRYSVLWGDEGAGSILSVLAGAKEPTFTSSPKLSHSFIEPGIFTFSVTARDAAGNAATGRFAVTVVARGSTDIPISTSTPSALPGSCQFANVSYPEGTETEGYTVNDLCLATNRVCLNRSSYIPKFKCTFGEWKEFQSNPYPGLPNYANMVGTQCAPVGSLQRGRTTQVVVHPSTVLCRDSLCATSQNFAPVALTCEYEIWVDWGIFSAGATSTGACAETAPCEYHYGSGGKACAAKQNGVCPTPKGGHPLGT